MLIQLDFSDRQNLGDYISIVNLDSIVAYLTISHGMKTRKYKITKLIYIYSRYGKY